MYYSVIGLLSVIIHMIINHDVFSVRGSQLPAQQDYRRFLYSVIIYHVTDLLWGVLYEWHYPMLLYADTVVYFAAMACSVLLWTRFVVRYLKRDDRLATDRFGTFLNWTGQIFCGFQLLALVVNAVHPILFLIDGSGEYHALFVRYAIFLAQILMFLLTSVYTLSISAKTAGSVRRRHLTIGLFGLAMIAAVGAQVFFPLLPMYSIGYLLGGCVLHSFVVEDEKAEYLRALEESMNREAAQQRELGAARRMVYTDSLTGVKSKHAYVEMTELMDRRMMTGRVTEFASAVFDVSGLKHINDTLGHKAGDRYIIAASEQICVTFKHSPVFRIGGDEFVAVLEGEDYANRRALMAAFDRQVEQNLRNGQVVVSAGLSTYDPKRDKVFASVFHRADERMYRRKRQLREKGAHMRD